MKPVQPFVTGSFLPGSPVCSRDEEIIRMITHANNRVNTILLGIQRMGKTTVIDLVMRRLENEFGTTCLYLDLLPTETLAGFAAAFARVVNKNFPEKHIDPIDPRAEHEVERHIHSLFDFLDKRRQKVIIVFDEFQQLARYPQKNAIDIARSATQKLNNICFIFGCSNEHLLNDFFDDSEQGFFTNFDLVQLNPIKQNVYAAFIRKNFEAHQRSINNDALSFILDFTRRHTYYTQVLCQRLFNLGIHEIDIEHVHEECGNILNENEQSYFTYRNLLSPVQWLLLKAIAKEESVYHPTARQFLMQHQVGTPANVQRALEALLSKAVVVASHDEKGRYYQVYDCFLSRWLENLD